jgi:hypothetical protein
MEEDRWLRTQLQKNLQYNLDTTTVWLYPDCIGDSFATAKLTIVAEERFLVKTKRLRDQTAINFR